MLKPVSLQGLELLRLGNPHADGGYLFGFRGNQVDVLLSYGVRDDVSFDLSFLRLFPECSVHLFDHTIDQLPIELPQFHFHRQGVGPRSEGEFGSISSHLLQFVPAQKSCYIKMDIEGAEYETLLSCSKRELSSVVGLVVEFHDIRPSNHLLIPLLRKLRDEFHLLHVHANNSGGLFIDGDVRFPAVIECTFLRKSSSDTFVQAELPNRLDRPCDPFSPEVLIKDFLN